ncbi:hypothetical protein EV386_2250 [Xylanimonas ulmi]|uniref:Uncharacterized protein n=1 Tax=Xylanimonas ulmi TaxID=228973 RepID=A0A4Q7M248_9MICO|nr:hypothetical protein EV386_2250 [Xylanibacterium ulmi]
MCGRGQRRPGRPRRSSGACRASGADPRCAATAPAADWVRDAGPELPTSATTRLGLSDVIAGLPRCQAPENGHGEAQTRGVSSQGWGCPRAGEGRGRAQLQQRRPTVRCRWRVGLVRREALMTRDSKAKLSRAFNNAEGSQTVRSGSLSSVVSARRRADDTAPVDMVCHASAFGSVVASSTDRMASRRATHASRTAAEPPGSLTSSTSSPLTVANGPSMERVTSAKTIWASGRRQVPRSLPRRRMRALRAWTNAIELSPERTVLADVSWQGRPVEGTHGTKRRACETPWMRS